MAIFYSEMKSDYSSKIRFNKLIKYLDYDLIFIDFYKNHQIYENKFYSISSKV